MIVRSLFSGRKTFFLKIEGRSMLPLLHPADVVYFRRVKGRVKIDDIVLVSKGKRSFVHRVIYNKSFLITKGDNSPVLDGKIKTSQVFGRAYQVKRKGRVFRIDDLYLFQSTHYFQEIIKVKKAFEKLGINFVFLKGLPIHLYFQKTHPKRIYADCDVLVARPDYKKAEKMLFKKGFQKAKTSFSSMHKRLKDKETEIVFYRNINNFSVVFDLHLEPVFLMNQLGSLNALYPQRLTNKMTEMFLNEKRTVKINGESFPILSRENLIVYLALHLFHHNFQGAFRYQLLDTVIRKSFLLRGSTYTQPENVSGFIKNYRLENFVYPVFFLLKKYYRTPFPARFLKSIRPAVKALRYFRNNILKINIFSGGGRVEEGVERFKLIFFLSPNKISRKLLVFLSPQVVYSVVWVINLRIRRILIRRKPSNP